MERLLLVTEVYRNDRYIRVQNVDKSWLIRYIRVDEKWPRPCCNTPRPGPRMKGAIVAETSLACGLAARSSPKRQACWHWHRSMFRSLMHRAKYVSLLGALAKASACPC